MAHLALATDARADARRGWLVEGWSVIGLVHREKIGLWHRVASWLSTETFEFGVISANIL